MAAAAVRCASVAGLVRWTLEVWMPPEFLRQRLADQLQAPLTLHLALRPDGLS